MTILHYNRDTDTLTYPCRLCRGSASADCPLCHGTGTWVVSVELRRTQVDRRISDMTAHVAAGEAILRKTKSAGVKERAEDRLKSDRNHLAAATAELEDIERRVQ